MLMYLPCLDILDGKDADGAADGDIVYEYDNEDLYEGEGVGLGRVPVSWNLRKSSEKKNGLSASSSSSSENKIVEIRLRHWCLHLDLAESISGASLRGATENSVLECTAINGQTELQTSKESRIGEKYFLSCSDDLSYDLVSVNQLEASVDCDLSKKIIASDLQSIGSTILCGKEAETVIMVTSEGKKGKFHVLGLVFPMNCKTSVAFKNPNDTNTNEKTAAAVNASEEVWPKEAFKESFQVVR